MTNDKILLKSKIILSLETLWNRNMLSPRQSMEPIAELVSQENSTSYSHFTFNTKDELRFLIQKLNRTDPGIIYMGSHGESRYFHLGTGNTEYLSLQELGEMFRNKLKGRVLHLSSCELFNVPEGEIKYLKSITGTAMLSGYTKSVDWLESSAMDMFLLDSILENSKDLNKVKSKLFKRFYNLVEYTGLLIY